MKEKNAKWENFWYYYKMPVILGMIALFFLAIALLGTLTNSEPDLKITMVTAEPQDNIGLYLKESMKDKLKDINDDQYIELSLRGMTLGEDLSTDENNQVQNSIESQLAYRGATLLIFDKVNFDRYIRKDAFQPLDNFFDVKSLGDRVIYRKDTPIALNLSGSKLLTDAGVIGDDFFGLLLFQRPEDSENSQIQTEYENAVIMLNALLTS